MPGDVDVDDDDDDFEAKSGCAICDVLGFETFF